MKTGSEANLLFVAVCSVAGLASCGSDDVQVPEPDAYQDSVSTDMPAALDALDTSTDAGTPFPALTPEACLPADPVDLAGIDPDYEPVNSGSFLQDRNWYLLTIFEGAAGVRSALDDDPAVGLVSKDRDQRFRQAAAGCEGDLKCVSVALSWSGDDVASTADDLVRVLVEAPGAVKPVSEHLRPSGMFHLHHELSDDEMLRVSFTGTMESLNEVLGKYALSLGPDVLDSLLNDVSTSNPDQMLFFEPLLKVAVGAMLVQGRDEAARYEPLAGGENKAAVQRIPSITWDDWRFPVILVPGWGPTNLDNPLSEPGRERCDLAAERWKAGLAPFIVPSGGHVHPDGTPYSEAIEMKKYLMAVRGVPEDAIIVDPYARHTTTNIRNTSRMMIRYGIPVDRPSLIATDQLQALYITALDDRCMDELGYLPYRKVVWLEGGDDCFLPAPTSLYADPRDPLDP